MADFECDTQKLREDGTKILEYVKSLDTDLDEFFSIIDNLDSDKIWVGNNSELYRTRVFREKNNYYKFTDGIRTIANEMISYSDDLETQVTKNEREFS